MCGTNNFVAKIMVIILSQPIDKIVGNSSENDLALAFPVGAPNFVLHRLHMSINASLRINYTMYRLVHVGVPG